MTEQVPKTLSKSKSKEFVSNCRVDWLFQWIRKWTLWRWGTLTETQRTKPPIIRIQALKSQIISKIKLSSCIVNFSWTSKKSLVGEPKINVRATETNEKQFSLDWA